MSTLVCDYCGHGPADSPWGADTFCLDGDGCLYHERCRELDERHRAWQREHDLRCAIIDAALDWARDHHSHLHRHDPAPHHDIIGDAHRRMLKART